MTYTNAMTYEGAYSDWFITTLNDGVDSFSFVDEERNIRDAKILDTRVEQREEAAGVASLSIRLAILS